MLEDSVYSCFYHCFYLCIGFYFSLILFFSNAHQLKVVVSAHVYPLKAIYLRFWLLNKMLFYRYNRLFLLSDSHKSVIQGVQIKQFQDTYYHLRTNYQKVYH